MISCLREPKYEMYDNTEIEDKKKFLYIVPISQFLI